MMKTFFSLIIGTILFGCGYDSFGDHSDPLLQLQSPTTTIAELRALYTGKPTLVNREYIINGYVSSSDKSNNFFKSIVIQDASGAVEIMAGLYNLHNIYPLGQRLLVSTHGLMLGKYNGTLQLGIANHSSSGAEVDYMGHRTLVDQHVMRDMERKPVAPLLVRLDKLTSEHCGMLVKIDNLMYSGDQALPTWGNSGFGTTNYHRFSDDSDNKILVMCSDYANFANREIPLTTLSLTGVFYLQSPGPQTNINAIKIRDLNDVQIY